MMLSVGRNLQNGRNCKTEKTFKKLLRNNWLFEHPFAKFCIKGLSDFYNQKKYLEKLIYEFTFKI